MQGILLIASRPTIKETFTAMLSPKFRVFCAESEAEGQDILLNNYRAIAAVLIELNLARKSGFTFADHMVQSTRFSLIPMIAISDELPVPEDMDCMEHGFFDLITAYAPEPLVYKRIGNAIRAKDSLSLSELERMLKELPSCIFLKDDEGKYVFSTQYWNHLDRPDDPEWTIRGKTDLEIRKDQKNARLAMEADKKILATGKGTDYIIEENIDGVQEFLQLIKRPVFDENGRISGIIALINNVTDHQLLKMELERRARTDTLTGLLNKSATQELVDMMLSGHQKENSLYALLILDIDFFKQVNDTFGHAEGDRVLAEIGRIINNNCRGQDVAGRIGGDEFMIFMRDISSPDNAAALAERLQNEVRSAFSEDKLKGRISFSIGISLYPENGKTFQELYKAADHALYSVKKNGRGKWAEFRG
ncbi:MAG: diguanylate cyclase [Anaerolineaceae bacterium]|nr:diguanylate cyclase [Anaerolineaceae bacterium]